MSDVIENVPTAKLNELLDNGNNGSLLSEILQLQPVEISEYLSTLDIEKIGGIITLLPNNIQGDVLCEFDTSIQNALYGKLPRRKFAEMFSEMPSESRVDFYKQLNHRNQVRLLPFLSKKIRQDVISLSAYSEGTAGGVMSTDFAMVFQGMTVKEAIVKLKNDAPSKKMIYYLYVVDSDITLKGFISLKDLIVADDDERIDGLLHENYISALVDDDKEYVSSMIEKYSLVAVPIVNDEHQLVGIVRYDDAISVIKDEQTEDIEKLMGITSYDESQEYLKTSCIQNYCKRITWIVGLFFLGILTSVVISRYDYLLSEIPVLALYLPMISAVGGNIGSQTSSVIIRALSLEDISINSWVSVLSKEVKVSIMMSLTLSFLSLLEVFILSSFNTHTYNVVRLAITVSFALCVQVVMSVILGASLPLLVKFFKKDPAIIASPAITTIVDVTGVIIYFTIALKILK